MKSACWAEAAEPDDGKDSNAGECESIMTMNAQSLLVVVVLVLDPLVLVLLLLVVVLY